MNKTRFTTDEARGSGEKLGIDWQTAPFDVEQYRMGLEIELDGHSSLAGTLEQVITRGAGQSESRHNRRRGPCSSFATERRKDRVLLTARLDRS